MVWYGNLLEIFSEALRSEQNASPNTCEAYNRDLKDFFQWLPTCEIAEITALHIRNYLHYLAEQDLEASTRARRLSTLRHFFKFLLREGISPDNPTLEIDSPR